MATGAKVHFPAGGDRIEVESGGSVNFKPGSRIEINGVDKTAALAAVPPEGKVHFPAGGDRIEVESGGSVSFKAGSRIEIGGVDKTAALAAVPPEGLLGVAAGYKLARGQHTTVAAVDTVVTGLATVVAVVAVLDSDPTLDPLFVTASIGDQAGAPAAGSVYIKSWQATAAGDVTPIAATTFGKKVNWIAVGT